MSFPYPPNPYDFTYPAYDPNQQWSHPEPPQPLHHPHYPHHPQHPHPPHYPQYPQYPCPYTPCPQPLPQRPNCQSPTIPLQDYGPEPLVVNIDLAARLNHYFRIALWTGCHLQVTLMSLQVGEEIGLESHPHLDQFLCIVEGQGHVMMGDCKEQLNIQEMVSPNCAILVPAGTWHNLTNIGCTPLKLYSLYAPPAHPAGTIHETKEEGEEYHD